MVSFRFLKWYRVLVPGFLFFHPLMNQLHVPGCYQRRGVCCILVPGAEEGEGRTNIYPALMSETVSELRHLHIKQGEH